MKIFNLTLPFLLVVAAKPPIIPIVPPEIPKEVQLSALIEPFSQSNQTTNIYCSLENVSSSSYAYFIEFSIINDLYPNGKVISTICREGYLSYYLIEYDNSYTRAENQLKIKFSHSDVVNTYVHNIPLVTRNSFIAHDGDTLTMSNLTTCLGGTWKENVEMTYKFESFPDLLIPTYYHELNLKDLYLTCSDRDFAKVTCKQISLIITNREGVFDDLYGNGDVAVIPLTTLTNDRRISFAFKNKMYVDPITLLMSSTPKEGYVETKHLYFPRNEMRYQGDFTFSIRMSDFGVGKYSVVSTHKINALINTLGDCYNSEYCILNKDAPINDVGWEI